MDWIDQCHFGDCRDTMRAMIAAGVKVQTIVTSPPYWGLRDYGIDGQIGLEQTFPEFLESLVEVFDLCRELLADDGTAWVNMGDSYSSVVTAVSSFRRDRAKVVPNGRKKSFGQLAPKNLIGQPFRLAFALQDAGWILRQDIVWHKPNPMPESVRDRCTKSHEYIFLLAKSDKYYFDQEAILEPVSPNTHARLSQNLAAQIGSERANGGAKTNGNMKAVARGVGWGHGTDADIRGRERVQRKGKEANPDPMARSASSMREATLMPVTERNRRSVWTIPTQSYSGAHFATFPEALVEPCVLAGTRPGDIVFDPFFGSGTTGAVASRLGRRWIGCELNPAYKPLQDDRLQQPGFVFEVVA